MRTNKEDKAESKNTAKNKARKQIKCSANRIRVEYERRKT